MKKKSFIKNFYEKVGPETGTFSLVLRIKHCLLENQMFETSWIYVIGNSKTIKICQNKDRDFLIFLINFAILRNLAKFRCHTVHPKFVSEMYFLRHAA